LDESGCFCKGVGGVAEEYSGVGGDLIFGGWMDLGSGFSSLVFLWGQSTKFRLISKVQRSKP
jgi:hypothetical protein